MRMEIHEQACRGCRMCVEICPTKVLTFDEATSLAKVGKVEDCIACMSCTFLCPSGAIHQEEYPRVKNFYRDLEFCGRMEKFL